MRKYSIGHSINFFLAVLCCLNVAFSVAQSQQVSITNGKLQGKAENGISVWLGIKYAQAQRFGVARAPQPWNGVKDVQQYGTIAPQIKSISSSGEPQSEDCLFLNIWSPAADDKKRPVMVWIHGGSFLEGSGSIPMYNGLNMAKQGDVVVVSINYRLGPLGFLYFKNSPSGIEEFENNLGLLDQIAALKWVKDNISSFGGDPQQVTIFGESAGGTSVLALLAIPAAQGLFRAAIAQSGPPSVVWKPVVAERITKKYLGYLGISSDSLSLLKVLPLDTLLAAQEKLLKYMREETDEKVFAPTIDGELLTEDLFSSMKPERNGSIPLLLGTNKDESTLFVKTMKTAPSNAEELEEYIDRISPGNKQRITAGYEKYPKKRAVMDILTDAIFRTPAIRLAGQRCTYAPVFMYRFEWTSPFLNMTGLRSFHGLEMPFVFGNTDRKTARIVKTIATRKTIERLSGEMQQAWINFARYGNPNGKAGSSWKPYTLIDRPTYIFDKESKSELDPDSRQRKAWEGVVYY